MNAVELEKRLAAATQSGIITANQAAALLPVLTTGVPVASAEPVGIETTLHDDTALANHSPEQREEPLKFLNNLGDLFIAIGIVFITLTLSLMMPLGWINALPIMGYIALSEWLVKGRRMLLPGMVIVVSILLFIGKMLPYGSAFSDMLTNSGNLIESGRGVAQYSLLAGAAAGAIYFWRYRLPFSIAVAVFMLLNWFLLVLAPDHVALTIWGCGFVVFLLAMLFDSQDTERVAYLSDAGFWLHCLAAPMLTHGFSIYLISNEIIDSAAMQFIAMGFYGVLMLVSLLVDRRAILLASITYFILLMTGVIGGGMANLKPSFVLLLIGSTIVLLGGFWYPLRRLLFGWLAGTPIGRWVPPLRQVNTR